MTRDERRFQRMRAIRRSERFFYEVGRYVVGSIPRREIVRRANDRKPCTCWACERHTKPDREKDMRRYDEEEAIPNSRLMHMARQAIEDHRNGLTISIDEPILSNPERVREAREFIRRCRECD